MKAQAIRGLGQNDKQVEFYEAGQWQSHADQSPLWAAAARIMRR